MKNMLKPLAVAASIAGAMTLHVAPSFARGGGGNIMNSPGYQRALAESHKAYLRAAGESVVVTPAYRAHRRHRHVR